ncbi:MAG TPA: fatty acid desaturase, partial [Gemmataceae bacterium]|nr:fatty acid desaturase [Gemmataceae bacterium]
MQNPVDLQGFAAAVDALRTDLDVEMGVDDTRHLLRIARWARAWTAAGYATAWLWPNPFSVFALAFGTFIRWAVLAHHTLHRGYDRCPGIPRRFTSGGFARGWRRAADWLDWLAPDAWRHEHNLLHHCRLNEDPDDPDLVESLVEWHGAIPRAARWLLLMVYATAWKPLFYAPNTLRLHLNAAARRRNPRAPQVPLGAPCLANPFHPYGRRVWLRCWLPYAAWRFGVAPVLFLPLGRWAWLSVLINSLLAEAVTNAHAFLMIVPNHAGDDLFRFDGPVKGGKGEFYVRQIVGTANYRCGSDRNDLLHGWLNYQIEHHVWPDLTLRQYQRAQPRLK